MWDTSSPSKLYALGLFWRSGARENGNQTALAIPRHLVARGVGVGGSWEISEGLWWPGPVLEHLRQWRYCLRQVQAPDSENFKEDAAGHRDLWVARSRRESPFALGLRLWPHPPLLFIPGEHLNPQPEDGSASASLHSNPAPVPEMPASISAADGNKENKRLLY